MEGLSAIQAAHSRHSPRRRLQSSVFHRNILSLDKTNFMLLEEVAKAVCSVVSISSRLSMLMDPVDVAWLVSWKSWAPSKQNETHY